MSVAQGATSTGAMTWIPWAPEARDPSAWMLILWSAVGPGSPGLPARPRSSTTAPVGSRVRDWSAAPGRRAGGASARQPRHLPGERRLGVATVGRLPMVLHGLLKPPASTAAVTSAGKRRCRADALDRPRPLAGERRFGSMVERTPSSADVRGLAASTPGRLGAGRLRAVVRPGRPSERPGGQQPGPRTELTATPSRRRAPGGLRGGIIGVRSLGCPAFRSTVDPPGAAALPAGWT